MLLEAKGLNVFYDTAQVLNDVSIEVDRGELVGLVGPNGAGKSMLMRRISGLIKWEKDTLKGTRFGDITIEGFVSFNGLRVDTLPAYQLAKQGLILCPERGRPFPEMTVYENIISGAYLCKDSSVIKNSLERVYSIFPLLKMRTKQVAGTLSGGERQELALARALMSQPKLLCIDEPSTGLAPKLKLELFNHIKEIFKMGISILLAEQDITFAFNLSNRNYLISAGRIIAQGTAEGLLKDEMVRKTYLGV